jgi:hypothetical protein
VVDAVTQLRIINNLETCAQVHVKILAEGCTPMSKMKIFVSWSGPRSAAVAEALKEYLPVINNAFEPWLSSDDIPKGSRSAAEIAEALVAAKAGIICLTPSNLNAPWILYEAGGIAKTVDKPLACTLLIDLEPSAVGKPLGDLQHTRLQEKELLKLIKTLNKAAGDDARQDAEIEKAFKLCWPELRERLDALPNDGPASGNKRSDRELLEELVDNIRTISDQSDRRIRESEQQFQEIRRDFMETQSEASRLAEKAKVLELLLIQRTAQLETYRAAMTRIDAGEEATASQQKKQDFK